MRRIVVEMSVEEFIKLKGGDPVYRSVRTLEALHQLRVGPHSSAAVARVEFKNPEITPETYFRGSGAEVEVLDEDHGIYTCFLKFRGGSILAHLGLREEEGFVVPPLEIKRDRARIAFAGTSRQIEHFLDCLAVKHIQHRTVSISDFRISPNSPLSALTERQREVLTTAYRHGYYDRPRKASSKEIARSLGMSSSTLVNHRLKAERRLLSVVLDQAGPSPRAQRR